MLNIHKLKHIKEDNHNLYHNLLIQLNIHSDSSNELLDAVENIFRQMNNMVEVINYLLEKNNN